MIDEEDELAVFEVLRPRDEVAVLVADGMANCGFLRWSVLDESIRISSN